MKRVHICFVIIVLMLSACSEQTQQGVTPPETPAPIETPVVTPSVTAEPPAEDEESVVTPEPADASELTDVVEDAFESLRKNDAEAVGRHMNYQMIAGESVETDNDKRFNDALFSRLSWKLDNPRLEGVEGTVEAEITNVDMVVVVNQYVVDCANLQREFDEMPSGDSYTEEQIEEKLFELLLQILEKTPETVTSVTTVRLTKESGEWQIAVDDALANSLTGNFNIATGG